MKLVSTLELHLCAFLSCLYSYVRKCLYALGYVLNLLLTCDCLASVLGSTSVLQGLGLEGNCHGLGLEPWSLVRRPRSRGILPALVTILSRNCGDYLAHILASKHHAASASATSIAHSKLDYNNSVYILTLVTITIFLSSKQTSTNPELSCWSVVV